MNTLVACLVGPARAYAVVAFVGAIAILAESANAQSTTDDTIRATARELAQEGIEAYQAGNYQGAQRKLEKAYRLFATPTLALWSARANRQLGQWVEAAERYRAALQVSTAVGDVAMQKQAQREATAELAELVPRIPSVTIELEGNAETDVHLSLDGAAASSEMFGVRVRMNPGAHRVMAMRGSERDEEVVRLEEGEHKQVFLRFMNAQLKVEDSSTAPVPKPATSVAALNDSGGRDTHSASSAVPRKSPEQTSPVRGAGDDMTIAGATSVVPLDSSYVSLRLGLGLGGSETLSIDSAQADIALLPSFGGALAYTLLVHPYFALGAELGLSSWRSNRRVTVAALSQYVTDAQQGSRNLLFDLALVPKGRLAVLDRLELYLAIPLSLALNNWNEIERNLSEGGQSIRIVAKPAFGFGFAALVGGRLSITDRLGVFTELGYGYRRFAHKVNTTYSQAATSTSRDLSVEEERAPAVSLHQLLWNFGTFF